MHRGAAGAAEATAAEITREEFRAIVSTYPSFSAPARDYLHSTSSQVDDVFAEDVGLRDAPPPPNLEIETANDHITVHDDRPRDESLQNSFEQHDHEQRLGLEPSHRTAIERMELRLEDAQSSHQELYDIYMSLPAPRAPYLSRKTLGKLLHRLAIVPRKTEPRMLRYLSILDDLKASNIPVSRAQYTSAIAFVGQAFSPVTKESVASAIRIYRAMEADEHISTAGARSPSLATHATFTALFDIAAKAQKFALAEVIAQEMDSRSLQPSRYFRVSRVLYEGLRGNGEGIRPAYQELVDSGEIVDTVVLNCVMSSFIRTGEVGNAELVFERMKRLDWQKRKPTSGHEENLSTVWPMGWRRKRHLGLVLTKAGRQLRNDPEAKDRFQNATPIAPDTHSYSLFLRHHAHTTGDMDRVSELLQDMHTSGLPVDNRVYKILFHGFALHGGVRYTSWKTGQLEGTWHAFLREHDEDRARLVQERKEPDEDAIYFDRDVAWAVLSAFSKCTTRQRTMQVWELIEARWRPSSKDMENIHRGLAIKFPKMG
ncbi:MAG: hypothetical protein M1821_005918 [Bathelium mastoideum]|nr:MAG: hypothetical protein M1821_005918 [Bathelium mastoideum]KAI9688542.1 MAG: hypothetical protein M1822_001491 [Bathelium mastoideum]